MHEVLNLTSENIRYAATIAGLAVGGITEILAQRRAAGRRQTLNEPWRVVKEQYTTTTLRKYGKVLGPIAALGAYAGWVNGGYWQQQEAPKLTPAPIEVVVDRSGATYKRPPGHLITKSVMAFEEAGGPSPQALIAQSGEVATGTIEDAIKTQPFGEAKLPQATQQAFNQIRFAKAQTAGNTANEAATVVITNGNSIGSVEGTIAEANAPDVRSSVYVVNVAKDAPTEIVNGLEKITAQTGGKYFNLLSKDDVRKIVENLKPFKEQPTTQTDWTERIVGAVGGAGMLGLLYFYREKLTFRLRGLRNLRRKEI